MKRLLLIGMIPLLMISCGGEKQSMKYDWNKDLHQRMLVDFPLKEAEVRAGIAHYIPHVTDSMMRVWEQSRALEYKMIDGQKRYFKQAVPNLFRIDSSCIAAKAAKVGPDVSDYYADDSINIPAIISGVKAAKSPFAAPHKMRVKYTLSVKPDVVPAGETIRCWMPVPRRDVARQKNVHILSANGKYTLAPDSIYHASLYMEKKAEKEKPTVFEETFEFTAYGEWHNLKPEAVKPYNTTTDLYKKYTAERPPQIVFSERIRHLADSLTAGENNPLLKARKIFTYIKRYPWASSREYSTIDNIPEYVLDNGHGDCGQVSLLFITLCRASGIPAHFQSGFMMHPHDKNLHDWSVIYIEGEGWIPVDQSFGFQPYAKTDEEHWFFVGGLDSWRLVVNQDYGMPLYPAKTYPRSETVDFQRGEVEWNGGNLYFPQWNYDYEITYLN